MVYLTLRGCVAKFGGHSLYGRKLFNFKAESPGLNRQKYYSLKKCIAFFYELYSFGHWFQLDFTQRYAQMIHNYSTSARWIGANRRGVYNYLI